MNTDFLCLQDIARRALKEAQKVVDARKKVTTDLDAEIAVRDLEVARLRVMRGLAGDSLAESEAIRDEKAAEVRQLGASSSNWRIQLQTSAKVICSLGLSTRKLQLLRGQARQPALLYSAKTAWTAAPTHKADLTSATLSRQP